MYPTRTSPLSRSMLTLVVVAATAAAAGCSSAADDAASAADAPTDQTEEAAAGSSESSSPEAADASTGIDLGAVGPLDSTVVHEITVTFDDADYDEMLAAYTATQEKEWIEATVTIDGATFEKVGLRLKGNSSLRGVTAASDPADLPWLIRLDEYVADQNLDGLTDLVVRSNNSTTAMNEAVALELLDLAGLASQDAVATSFSVNGSDAVLRLVVDLPEDQWMAEELDADGALYKAESGGDYSYRGDDPGSYDDVFDQEAGKDNADLTPLIEFLDFVNNADDAAFEAELPERLDVDALATYLAMQELVDNFDDIDGPGNNSYLYYDPSTEQFTVVAWDHNLAFGVRNGGGGQGAPAGAVPGGAALADDAGAGGRVGGPAGGGPAGGGGPGGSNVLAERFLATEAFAQLYEQRLAELRADLYTSGLAAEVLDEWSAVVTASGLVDSTTIATEADQIAAYFGP